MKRKIKKGFTYIEMMVAMGIVTAVAIAIFSYLMVTARTEQKLKKRIDVFNVAQTILSELKGWNYKGEGTNNLLYLKDYLEDNNNEYLKYLNDVSSSNIYEIGEINDVGENIYTLELSTGTVRVKVKLDFMEEDIDDIDGDGITQELVPSTKDHNIIRISVKAAEYIEGVADDKLNWATTIGHKGIQSQLPGIDLVINDTSDDGLDLSAAGAAMLAIDYRKNADILNGLNNLDNFSPFDKDGVDNDGDGKIDYTDGDVLEADSDNIDNDGDGVTDEAFEQEDMSTDYNMEIYSSEPFLINPSTEANIQSGDVGVFLKAPGDTAFTDITGNFSEKTGTDITPNTIYVYNNYTINSDSEEGQYEIKVMGRTNPDRESGFYMERSYSYIVDVTSPEIAELSPDPGTFVPNQTVTIAVTVTDNFALDRIYVFEKKELEEGYTWNLVKHESINLEIADVFTNMNVGVTLEDVPEGEHHYRVVVKDKAGNVDYDETSVYVTDEPDLEPPVVIPETPNVSGIGTNDSPYLSDDILTTITAKIVDSKIEAGVETQSGVYIGRGWPEVYYKIYDYSEGDVAPDIDTITDITTLDGIQVATSRSSYIKHNVNNVTISFEILEELAQDDKILLGVKAKDKAGNIMSKARMWYVEYQPDIGNNSPSVSHLHVRQKSNHPNLEPPFIYTPDWKDSDLYPTVTDQENKNFYIGWSSYDQDGIKKWEVHYTEVVPPNWTNLSMGDIRSVNSPKNKDFDLALINDGQGYGVTLSDLNLDLEKNFDDTSPYLKKEGVFYFYISVTEYDPTDTTDYTGDTSYYYLSDEDGDGTPDTPAVQTSSPGDLQSDIASKWIPVKVENLRLLLMNLDDIDGSITSQFYTSDSGPFYWRYDSTNNIEDCVHIDAATITKDYLVSKIDKDSNGSFDDYDMVLFFSGSDTPDVFTDDAIKLLHRYFAAPYDTFRSMDSDDFYPDDTGDGIGNKEPVYYDESESPRFVFIGKRMFHNFALGSEMQKYFINRWFGLDHLLLDDYSELSNTPYIISNLREMWKNSTSNDSAYNHVKDLEDPVLGEFIGEIKKDSNGDELDRTVLDNYIKKLEIANDGVGFYDGYDNQSTPDRWNLLGESLTYNFSDYPRNPAIHVDGFYNGPNDWYLYATKPSGIFGADTDNINYGAAFWMYPGIFDNDVSKWEFGINEYYNEEEQILRYYINRNTHTKLYHLGFNVEAVSTERDRYATLK